MNDYEAAKERAEANPGLPALSSLTTRHLLALRDGCHRCGAGWFSEIDSSGPGYYLQDILSELGTREHIPNKKEAAALRRASRPQKRKLKFGR